MAFETLIYEIKGQVGILQFNRPKAYNALNRQVFEELNQAMDMIHNKGNLRALL